MERNKQTSSKSATATIHEQYNRFFATRTVYPLTRTTFRLPFPPPPPPMAGATSCAVIPAFNVSISTPLGIAGE